MHPSLLVMLKVLFFLALALGFSTLGLTIPWKFPAWAFPFALVILWVAVSAWALSSKGPNSGWSPQNCGFSLGDILLAAAIGLSAAQIATLSKDLWFMSTGFRAITILVGFLVIGPTIEYLGWKGSHRAPFGWGDLYHHSLYGLLTCWVVTSLIGTWYDAWTRTSVVSVLVSAAVTGLVVAWLGLIVIQARIPQDEKKFYGWGDLGRALHRLIS